MSRGLDACRYPIGLSMLTGTASAASAAIMLAARTTALQGAGASHTVLTALTPAGNRRLVGNLMPAGPEPDTDSGTHWDADSGGVDSALVNSSLLINLSGIKKKSSDQLLAAAFYREWTAPSAWRCPATGHATTHPGALSVAPLRQRPIVATAGRFGPPARTRYRLVSRGDR